MKTRIIVASCLFFLSACSQQRTANDEFSFQKDPNSLREDSVRISCGATKNEDDCSTTNYDLPPEFTHHWSQLFYDGEDIYASLLREKDLRNLSAGEWCIFKNGEQLFCEKMNAGATGPIFEMRKTTDGISLKYLFAVENGKPEFREKIIE
jgi:hypothetical protein